jgi:hypothetical protein
VAHTALLIGAETYGLLGVRNDVTAMSRLLLARGFTTTLCSGAEATRAGILDAYELLIAEADPDDAVVVYYSGHGGEAADARFIVPADFAESTDDDFRGITELELSVLQARLTDRCRNVVTILDCCHAARMSREPTLKTKAIARVRNDLAAHHRRLIRGGLRTDLLAAAGNEDAVRLVACAADGEAGEDLIGGRWTGVFTAALTAVLGEAAALPVSWSELVAQIRRRMAEVNRAQRPEAEGPARRLVFETREIDPADSLPAIADPLGVRLEGAPFFGHRDGDVFVVMPPSFPGPDRDSMVGEVTIERLLPTAAVGRLRPDGELPIGARAHCVRANGPALAVDLPPLAGHKLGSAFVRAGDTDESCPVQVRFGPQGEFTIHDRIGPLHTHAGWVAVVPDLTRLGRAAALRGLENDAVTGVELSWGRVADGSPQPEPATGGSVEAGHPIYLIVHNRGTRTAWVSLIDIGVTAGITVLTRFAPSGLDLAAGESWTYGEDATGKLTGMPPHWPSSLASPLARPETVLALITPEPLDVSGLEQGRVGRGEDPLSRLLPRATTRARAAEGSYAVRKVSFTLVPPAGGVRHA